MPRKLIAGFVGAILVVVILGLQAVEHWTIVDSVLTGLKNKGPVGAFVSGMLTSPILPLVIALAAIYLVFEGRKERHGSSGENGSGGNPVTNTATGGTANATAKVVGDVHFHTGAVVPPRPPQQEPDDPPIISFEESQNIFIANAGWVWVEYHEGLPVLVAVFRNRIRGVGIPTPIAYRVSAHLTFKSTTNTISVDHGAWVGEYTYFTEFKPNDVRKLVVVLHDQNNVFCTMRNFCSSDPRRQRIRSGVTNIHHPTHLPLSDEEWEVEIVLVESDTALFSRKFWLRAKPGGGWLLLS